MTPVTRGALAAFAITCVATTASADKPPSSDAQADRLFRAGEKKFDAGDFPGACMDFSESLRLGPKLGTLLNLALCHEQTGKLVTAWSEFAHAAAWAAQNGQRDRVDFAREHVRALDPRLPRVVLQLPADQTLGGIDLDGEPMPETRWYLPLYLDAGQHQLAVSAPGHRRATVAFRVNASPGDQIVIVPNPEVDEAVSSTAQTKAAASAHAGLPTLGLVGIGLGALGLGVGTIYGFRAIAGDDRDPAVHSYATVSTVAFLAGAAAGSAGGYVIWKSRTKRVAVAPFALRGTF